MESKRRKFYKNYSLIVRKKKKLDTEISIPDHIESQSSQQVTGQHDGDQSIQNKRKRKLPTHTTSDLITVEPGQQAGQLPMHKTRELTINLPGLLGVKLLTQTPQDRDADLPVQIAEKLSEKQTMHTTQGLTAGLPLPRESVMQMGAETFAQTTSELAASLPGESAVQMSAETSVQPTSELAAGLRGESAVQIGAETSVQTTSQLAFGLPGESDVQMGAETSVKPTSEPTAGLPGESAVQMGAEIFAQTTSELAAGLPGASAVQMAEETSVQATSEPTAGLPGESAVQMGAETSVQPTSELTAGLHGESAMQMGAATFAQTTSELAAGLPGASAVQMAEETSVQATSEPTAGLPGESAVQMAKETSVKPTSELTAGLHEEVAEQLDVNLPKQTEWQLTACLSRELVGQLSENQPMQTIRETTPDLPEQSVEKLDVELLQHITRELTIDLPGQAQKEIENVTLRHLDKELIGLEKAIEQPDKDTGSPHQNMDIDSPIKLEVSASTFTERADNHCESGSNKKVIICEQNIMTRDEEIELCLNDIRSQLNDDSLIVVIEQEEETSQSKNMADNHTVSQERSIKKKLDKKTIYKHIDFLSSDEDFAWSSSSWQGTTDSDSEVSNNETQRAKKKQKKKKNKKPKNTNKRGRKTKKDKKDQSGLNETETEEEIQTDLRIKPKKKINKALERSSLKNSGKEYVTKKGKTIEAKRIKENPCKEDKCLNKCFKIPEERRQAIFNHYWGLDKERRKDWLVSNCKREQVKRKRIKGDMSRRQWTYTYFINEGEGRRPVCLQFLCNTLDIQQKFIHNTVSNSVYGSSKDDLRGKHVPPNKTSDQLIESVKTYIQNLPALPSHYCRKNSKKVYLPQEFKNLNHLYRIYKETMSNEGNLYVGEKVFKNIFSTFNISFHVPRKDKCMKCIKYENDKENKDLEEEKKIHLKDRDETYKRFEIHQQLHNQDSTVLCTTFDLQKVLNTPYGESMLLYYSRKLAVYNLTFYESITRDGYCFTWTESEGKRGSNEVSTILELYITKVDERKSVRHLLLYSDACPGQNRNKVVLACLSRCLQKCKYITSIQMNYLLPGHTYMPVDSMHSIIERSIGHSIIWAPSQWPTVFSLARKSERPYNVKVLAHEDFKAWDTNADKFFKGNLIGKISKIRVAMLKKSSPDKMMVKYSMNEEAETETIDIVGKPEVIKKLYKAPLPISKKKHADLVKLCTNKTIPQIYHNEYINLPNAGNVIDTIPESDIEEE